MKQILLMIGVVALVGCGKKEPGQPTMPKSEITKPEPTKTKATVGSKLWEFETIGPVYSSPAIGSDGTVYFGRARKLYAINGKSGRKLWEFETGEGLLSDPAIAADGTVYVGSEHFKLFAIKTDSKGLTKSPWPMRGQNARHTGRAPTK